jgi:hypothetical protein
MVEWHEILQRDKAMSNVFCFALVYGNKVLVINIIWPLEIIKIYTEV